MPRFSTINRKQPYASTSAISLATLPCSQFCCPCLLPSPFTRSRRLILLRQYMKLYFQIVCLTPHRSPYPASPPLPTDPQFVAPKPEIYMHKIVKRESRPVCDFAFSACQDSAESVAPALLVHRPNTAVIAPAVETSPKAWLLPRLILKFSIPGVLPRKDTRSETAHWSPCSTTVCRYAAERG